MSEVLKSLCLENMCMKKLFALEIKSKQVIPAEIASTT